MAVSYSVSKPLQSQIDQKNKAYNNSQVKANAAKWQNATIQDLGKKYGFDYSKEYANRQAAAEAQAKTNAINDAKRTNQTANKQTLKQVDTGIRDANSGLDHSYFQQFLAQNQANVNRGMNAGIAQDSQLRLAMNKQGELADVYRQANLTRSNEMDRYNNESIRLAEALGLLIKEIEDHYAK